VWLRFVQISDSHIGFDKPANTDVTATLRAAVAKIKAAPEQPSFVLHTGDLTHLSKPSEFDTLQQVLAELALKIDVTVPKGGGPATVEFTAPTAGRYEIAVRSSAEAVTAR
jgi:3',5'-cyclic AMP phosphodiesterase CpdA